MQHDVQELCRVVSITNWGTGWRVTYMYHPFIVLVTFYPFIVFVTYYPFVSVGSRNYEY